VWAAAAFGVLMLAAAAAPTLPLQIAALVPLGMVTVTFAAGVNSTLQLAVEPAMRGRVMALYSVVFLGSTPIGAPLVGWLAGSLGPRAGLVVGAVAAFVAALGARAAFARVGEPIAPVDRHALRRHASRARVALQTSARRS
jgi:MFS family permease